MHIADELKAREEDRREVMALSQRLVREGRLGEAEAALTEGLHAVRQLGDASSQAIGSGDFNGDGNLDVVVGNDRPGIIKDVKGTASSSSGGGGGGLNEEDVE